MVVVVVAVCCVLVDAPTWSALRSNIAYIHLCISCIVHTKSIIMFFCIRLIHVGCHMPQHASALCKHNLPVHHNYKQRNVVLLSKARTAHVSRCYQVLEPHHELMHYLPRACNLILVDVTWVLSA